MADIVYEIFTFNISYTDVHVQRTFFLLLCNPHSLTVNAVGTGRDGNITIDGSITDMGMIAYPVIAPPENQTYINISGTGFGIGSGDRVLLINIQGWVGVSLCCVFYPLTYSIYLSISLSLSLYIYIYIYIYLCLSGLCLCVCLSVCVCVCVCVLCVFLVFLVSMLHGAFNFNIHILILR